MIGTPAGGPLAGRFELLDEVGSGGMGTVYRARDLATSAYVAVKLLIAQRLLPSEIDRFQREARLLAELRHVLRRRQQCEGGCDLWIAYPK